jgi:threonine synthase
MASGSLLTKIHKAYKEFIKTGILEDQPFSIHGAQAGGCSPISEAMKKGIEIVKPPFAVEERGAARGDIDGNPESVDNLDLVSARPCRFANAAMAVKLRIAREQRDLHEGLVARVGG